jgi:hypothetical protein
MTVSTILIIILIIFLLGGFVDVNGRGFGYGFGPVGFSLPGVLLLIVIILLVTGRL